jgi:GT2 family glycosyltransferase
MVSPTVTVLVAYYNQGLLLRECLASVIAQTHRDWEVVVVDDGSCSQFGRGIVQSMRDPRIRYIRHSANRGNAAARNTGFHEARAQRIVQLDADDVLSPRFLDTVVQSFDRAASDRAAVVTDQQLFGAYSDTWRTDAQTLRQFVHRKRVPGPGVLIHRRLWERVGGYCERRIVMRQEDTEFWLAALGAGMKLIHVPEPLYCQRKHGRSLTATPSQSYHAERKAIYERRRHLIDGCGAQQFLADGLWRSALARWQARRYDRAARFALKALAACGAPPTEENLRLLLDGLRDNAWYCPIGVADAPGPQRRGLSRGLVRDLAERTVLLAREGR